MSLEQKDRVRAIGQHYPCCGHIARFLEDETNQAEVERICRHCGRTWRVERKKGRPDEKGRRLDRLTWKDATDDEHHE